MKKIEKVIIFTDGACFNNPGKVWSAILMYKDKIKK